MSSAKALVITCKLLRQSWKIKHKCKDYIICYLSLYNLIHSEQLILCLKLPACEWQYQNLDSTFAEKIIDNLLQQYFYLMFCFNSSKVGPISNATTLPPTEFARLKEVSPMEHKCWHQNCFLVISPSFAPMSTALQSAGKLNIFTSSLQS